MRSRHWPFHDRRLCNSGGADASGFRLQTLCFSFFQKALQAADLGQNFFLEDRNSLLVFWYFQTFCSTTLEETDLGKLRSEAQSVAEAVSCDFEGSQPIEVSVDQAVCRWLAEMNPDVQGCRACCNVS